MKFEKGSITCRAAGFDMARIALSGKTGLYNQRAKADYECGDCSGIEKLSRRMWRDKSLPVVS